MNTRARNTHVWPLTRFSRSTTTRASVLGRRHNAEMKHKVRPCVERIRDGRPDSDSMHSQENYECPVTTAATAAATTISELSTALLSQHRTCCCKEERNEGGRRSASRRWRSSSSSSLMKGLSRSTVKPSSSLTSSLDPDFHEVVDLLCDSDEEMPPVVDAEEFLLGAVNEKVLCQAGVCHPRRRHAG